MLEITAIRIDNAFHSNIKLGQNPKTGTSGGLFYWKTDKMFAKLALIALLVVAVASNPQANSNRKFIHRRITVSPNIKAVPFPEVVKSVVLPPRPKASGITRVPGCGTAPLAPANDVKIVGGNNASPHEYPWQVALYIDNMFFCGGSIISNEWVMTAAHCMDGAISVDVVAGAHDLSLNEPSQVTLTSTTHFVHENWNSLLIRNDIAMIRLPQLLTFNDFIQPVCLPSGADLGAGVAVVPTGWGKDHDGIGGVVDILNEVTVPTITNIDCAVTYGATITDDMICIDSTGGMGTCNGDSGGPLNYQVAGITETRGITSFGASAGCEAGFPDAFTRVNHYLQWILDNTGVTQ